MIGRTKNVTNRYQTINDILHLRKEIIDSKGIFLDIMK